MKPISELCIYCVSYSYCTSYVKHKVERCTCFEKNKGVC
jgi:hypothetical protein